jgi:hypothetical protein
VAIPLGKLDIIELAVDKFEDGGTLFHRTRHRSFLDSMARAFCMGTPLLAGQDETSIKGGMMLDADDCAPQHFVAAIVAAT